MDGVTSLAVPACHGTAQANATGQIEFRHPNAGWHDSENKEEQDLMADQPGAKLIPLYSARLDVEL